MRDHLFPAFFGEFLPKWILDDFNLWLIYSALKRTEKKRFGRSEQGNVFSMTSRGTRKPGNLSIALFYQPTSAGRDPRGGTKIFLIRRHKRREMIYRFAASTIEITLITERIIWRLNERHERGMEPISHQLWDLRFFCFSIIGFNWTIGNKSPRLSLCEWELRTKNLFWTERIKNSHSTSFPRPQAAFALGITQRDFWICDKRLINLQFP